MSLSEVKESIRFIFEKALPRVGINPSYVTIAYIGGEILTYPESELNLIVRWVRSYFALRNIDISDGVQTNLICSPERAKRVYDLFDGRVGTSIDASTQQRTLKGSHEHYAYIWNTADEGLADERHRLPAVLVVDKKSIPNIHEQLLAESRKGRAVTLRPLFAGGNTVHMPSSDEVLSVMTDAFKNWFLKTLVIVEPFTYMLQGRLNVLCGKESISISGCPNQSDCAKRSLSLDPNGDLYLCQESADADINKLGNAIDATFDVNAWEIIDGRRDHLPLDCRQCSYIETCHGGCAFEAQSAGLGIYGQTPNCKIWKSLYHEIDAGIKEFSQDRVQRWLNVVLKRNQHLIDAGRASIDKHSTNDLIAVETS